MEGSDRTGYRCHREDYSAASARSPSSATFWSILRTHKSGASGKDSNLHPDVYKTSALTVGATEANWGGRGSPGAGFCVAATYTAPPWGHFLSIGKLGGLVK